MSITPLYYLFYPGLHTSIFNIPSGKNKMDNKSYDQLLIMQAMIESNKQDSDEKMKNITVEITGIITSMMDQIEIYKSSPNNNYSKKYRDTTTVVPSNNKDTPLEGGYSMKIGGMWTLKH